MDFMEVVEARQSVRSISDQPVEEDKITRILECARLAPSWANKQCWHFVVVTDRSKLEELSKAMVKFNSWIRNSPAVIVACGDPKESGSRNEMDYFLVDVAIAMEHLVLAATDLGLGTCWMAAFDEGKARDVLGIPEEIKVVAMTPLGYPLEKRRAADRLMKAVSGGKKRKPLEEMVHRENW